MKILTNIFKAPDHGDEEKNRIAQFLQITLVKVFVVSVIIAALSIIVMWEKSIIISIVISISSLICIYLNKTGWLKLSSNLIMLILLAGVSLEAYFGDGIHDLAIIFYPIFVILASLFFNNKGYISYTVLTLLSIASIAWFRSVNNFADYYVDNHLVEVFVIWSVLIIEAILFKRITNWFLETLRKVSLNELRYRSIYENIQDVYFEISIDGKIIEITPSIERFTILKREELIGMEMNKFYKNQNEREKVIHHLMNFGELRNYETQLVDVSGRVFDVILNIVLIRDNEGNPLKTAGSIHDNTSVKKLQNQLLQSQKLEATGTLAGGIAHDFNNILGAIMGFLQIVQRKYNNVDGLDNYVRKMLSASGRAKELVAQILAFSRRSNTDKLPIDLNHILDESYKFLRASIPTSIEINFKNNAVMGMVLGNETQIQQIIMNLCTNSYHAVDLKHGLIEISLSEIELRKEDLVGEKDLNPGNYIKITVSDNGHGIDDEIKEKIFDPYFTTKKHGEGTGLGLSTVLGIVKEHGGKINIYSEKDTGTTINIFLPSIDLPNTEIIVQDDVIIGGNDSILLIDDEILIVENTAEILVSLGYKVHSFVDPEEALEYFQDNSGVIDLVITDMTMPKLSGIQVIQAVRVINPDMPVIISTGYSKELSQSLHGLPSNTELLNKPFLINELTKAIRSILNGSKSIIRTYD